MHRRTTVTTGAHSPVFPPPSLAQLSVSPRRLLPAALHSLNACQAGEDATKACLDTRDAANDLVGTCLVSSPFFCPMVRAALAHVQRVPLCT